MPEHTKYRFLPTVRRGYRPSTPFNKSDLGDFTLTTQGQTTVEYTAEVTEGPDAPRGKGTAQESVDLSMYGPAHVTGIDESQVVRMEPEPGSSTTPPNYFPFVEFETPDLPWLFSPVKAGNQGRNFPWLTLVAVPKEKASVSAAGGRPNPVLEVKPELLGPVEDAWAWAHAQVTGDPSQQHPHANDALEAAITSRSDATVSRLICPRNLQPSTSYVAAVVPTFEAGRKVGLGEEPPSQEDSGTPKRELAWNSNSSSKKKSFPVYHHWEFTTSEKGDFEYLVRQLEPEDLTSDEYAIGYREVDVTDPGPETLDYEDGNTHTVKLGGALQATECDDWWWYERSDQLRKLLNVPASAIPSGTDKYQVIGPPVYGRWHSQEIFERNSNSGGFLDLTTGDGFDWGTVSASGMEWCDSDTESGTVPTEVQRYDGYGPVKPKLGPAHHAEADLQWLYDLNLTPSFRIPASVGVGIVQDQQENLMISAWDQVGDVRDANRRLAAAQLSAGAMRQTVDRMSASDYPIERLLQVTEPAHDRIYVDSQDTTAAEHLANSRLREPVLSPAFRRLTSPAGRLSQRLDGPGSGAGIVSGLLDDELDTSIAAGPEGMVGTEATPESMDELCADARGLGEIEGEGEYERPSWREPRPEQRDRESDEGVDDQFQPPAKSAVDRLRKMREDTEYLLGTLAGIRDRVANQEPTTTTVTLVRRDANDAVGTWHSLDIRVRNFGSVIASVSANSGSLPNVADSFDQQTRVDLYGDLSPPTPTYGDMTRPFQEPFLPSVSDSLVWSGGLRTFSGPALEDDLTEEDSNPETDSESDDDESDDDESDDDEADDESEGPSYPVTLGEVRAAEDNVEAVQGAIDDILGYFGEGGSDVAYLVRLFCERSYADPEPGPQPDKTAVAESWTPIESFVDRTIERLGAPGLRRRADPLDTIMAYPEFDQPMYRDLKNMSEKYILPGAESVPNDSVGALRTNRRFIEAFMVGLNYEMGSELLWRNFPADRRGSYFKRFWDQRSRIPKPDDDDKLDDIIPLHRWDDKGSNNRGVSPLGSNVRTGETDSGDPPDDRSFGGNTPDPDSISPTVVLLIRGELLRRYPNTAIYAAKAEDNGGDRDPAWASADEKATQKDTAKQKFPIFRGQLEPDITFFGFDLTVEEAVNDPYHRDDTAEPDTQNDKGWFFVLSEPPGETKFGLDIGQEGETEPPFGISKGHGSPPARTASEKQIQEGVETGWAGLSWKHLPTGNGGDPTHVRVDDHAPGKGSDDWTVEKGDVWAKEEAWKPESDETEHTAPDTPEEDTEAEFEFGPEEAATWGRNSAHMAFITWQKPVRVAIHASDVLPEDGQ